MAAGGIAPQDLLIGEAGGHLPMPDWGCQDGQAGLRGAVQVYMQQLACQQVLTDGCG